MRGGGAPICRRAGAALSRAMPTPDPWPVGRTRKEQLSRPIMMCVSSGNGGGAQADVIEHVSPAATKQNARAL